MGSAQCQNMDRKDLVSVIVPAYYSGVSLWDAVESVLEQTYRPLQLIVCDDGTDGFSADALRKELSRYGRETECTVIHHAENLGTVENLCSGLELAKGEWVILLAADDRLLNRTVVEGLIRQAEEQNAEWIVPKTALGSANGPVEPGEELSVLLRTGDGCKLYERLCFHCCLPASGGLYRKKVLQEAGGFDRRFRLVEDWPLFLKLVRNGILPKESGGVVTVRAAEGVSGSRAGKNYGYQKDLMNVMREVILPEREILSDKARKRLERWIKDKESIFELRFQCKTMGEKLGWFLSHPGVILRKMRRGGTAE